MANRRDLTDRNREQQQPGQPIDFCQGLPFKVRWMGRDAQTGRDLVQFPDGSIVRAGKRIFSGNCPRGTMVDVVDCGANGAITIDWRDAEIRQPLLIPEVPADWVMIIDTATARNFALPIEANPSQFLYQFAAEARKYYQNIKKNQSVLLLFYDFTEYSQFPSDPTIVEDLADTVKKMYVSSAGSVVTTSFDLPTKEEISAHDQIWIVSDGDDSYSPRYDSIPPDLIDFIVASKKKLFLLVQGGSIFQTTPTVSFEESRGVLANAFLSSDPEAIYQSYLSDTPDPVSRIINKLFNFKILEGSYLPPVGETRPYPTELIVLNTSDPLLNGISRLYSGGSLTKINIPPASNLTPLVTVNRFRDFRKAGPVEDLAEETAVVAAVLRR